MLETADNPSGGVAGISTSGYLRFSHPHLDDALVITSGANSIKWAYTLNTNQQSTIGGEVIQILGAYVGPLMIEGIAASVEELVEIKSWFVKVFTLMGTQGFRDETAVKFEYPKRNWQFLIQPTKLRGFKYDKTVFAPPWQVEAEIISDNALDYLNAATFTAFTGPLLNPDFAQVGYSDPTAHGDASKFVNPDWSGSVAGLGATMGDNFQRLVEQFSAGGFGDFAFNSSQPYSDQTKKVQDEYNAIFGTPGLQTAGGSGSGSGSSSAGSGTSSNDTNNSAGGVVSAINDAFTAVGIPGELGVAVAIHESGLNPDQTQYGCNTGACGIGLFQVNGDGTGRDGNNPQVKAAGQNRVYGSSKGNVAKYYPMTAQVSAAAGWFDSFAKQDFPGVDMTKASDQTLGLLAAHAQGPRDAVGFAAAIVGLLPRARQQIKEAKTGDTTGTTDVQGVKNMTGIIETHGSMTPVRIILHDTEGILDATALPSFFANHTSGYGCHIGASQDGTLVRLAADDQITYHTADHNTGSLGLEMCAPNGAADTWANHDWMSYPKQFQAVANQLAFWCSAHNISATLSTVNGISTHAMNIGVPQHHDPGPGYPLEQLIARVATILNAPNEW